MSLKVFDLECASGHVFEGWFGSHDDYDQQLQRGLLSCPLCDSHTIVKRLSAPRINVKHARVPVAVESSASNPSERSNASASPTLEANQVARLQAALMKQVRQVINSAENVGPRFAEEARRMHEGEGQARAIRGTATAQERESLAEEGIDVVSVPDMFDDDRLQ